jgi:hypothetical protein
MSFRPLGVIALVLTLPASIFAQTISGTCSTFVDFFDAHGVQVNGMDHPLDPTWTTATFDVTVANVKTTYIGRIGKLQCYAGDASFHVTAIPTYARLDWNSTDMACDSCACKAEHDKYEKAVDDLIAKYGSAARDLADQWSTEWTDPKPVCVRPTLPDLEDAAIAEETRRAKQHAGFVKNELQRFYEKSARNFANNILSSVVLPPDCAACKTCGPGQTPTCSVCAAPKVVYQNQCVSGCGPLIPGPPLQYQNCGVDKMSMQPVACCPVQLDPTSPAKTAICSPLGTAGCP